MKRILVVEDEAGIREMVALNLKLAGWEVLEAPSAERALELLHAGAPCDAALLDIMLPGMDGLSLCETIRRDDPDIGIIIVSAKGQEQDKIRGLSIGADDYITKPSRCPSWWPGWRRWCAGCAAPPPRRARPPSRNSWSAGPLCWMKRAGFSTRPAVPST